MAEERIAVDYGACEAAEGMLKSLESGVLRSAENHINTAGRSFSNLNFAHVPVTGAHTALVNLQTDVKGVRTRLKTIVNKTKSWDKSYASDLQGLRLGLTPNIDANGNVQPLTLADLVRQLNATDVSPELFFESLTDEEKVFLEKFGFEQFDDKVAAVEFYRMLDGVEPRPESFDAGMREIQKLNSDISDGDARFIWAAFIIATCAGGSAAKAGINIGALGVMAQSALDGAVTVPTVKVQQPARQEISVNQFINDNVPPQFRTQVRNAFESDVQVRTLTRDEVFFRYYGGESGPSSYWFTPNRVSNPRSTLALPPGNTAQHVDRVVIPRGTTVLEGTIAPNFGQPGGGQQIFVPNLN